MYGERKPVELQRPPEVNDVHARLNWLVAANARQAESRSLFRDAAQEEEFLLMRRPLDVQRAFALLGLMLGLFPPAAIFIKLFGYGLGEHMGNGGLLFVACLLMNAVCAWVGRGMGKVLGRTVGDLEKRSWAQMMLTLPVLGIAWGGVTGFAGGLIFFGFGGFIGAVFAIPVGMQAFTLFGALHRLLVRGGMIDARHFWPLATGATLLAAAAILGV